MTLKFTGDDTKKVDVIINGHRISIDTNKREDSRLIDIDVQSGTNAIELVPKTDVEIVTFSVALKRRS